jgi:hypothetical protein
MTLRKWAAGIAAFVLLATAAPALATTYYVNASWLIQGERNVAGTSAYNLRLAARDARAGTSSALCWGTITKANATVASGDVVIIEDNVGGSYMEQPDPACQATASGWVTYIGNLGNPKNTTCEGYYLNKPYTSVKGIQFLCPNASGFQITSSRDSINYCEFSADRFDFTGATYSFVGNSFINTGVFNSSTELPWRSVGNTFNSNTFVGLGTRSENGGSYLCIGRADSCSFLFNTFDTPSAGAISTASAFKLAYSSGVKFRGNKFTVGEGAIPDLSVRTLRDSVMNASFDCDTVICTGMNRKIFWLGYDGNTTQVFESSTSSVMVDSVDANGRPVANPVRGTSIDSCYFDFAAARMIFAKEGFDNLSITNSVIINRSGPPLFIADQPLKHKNTLDHNTFVGLVESEYWPLNGVMDYGAPVMVMNPSSVEDTLTVTNNIFYGLQSPSGSAVINFALKNNKFAGVEYSPAKFDTTFWNQWARLGHYDSGFTHNNLLVSENNLYSYYGSLPASSYEDSIGKRSITFIDADWNRIFTWPGLASAAHDHTAYSADSINIVPGTFADTVSVVAGVFADSITITLRAHASLPLADSTFKVAVVRTTVTPPSSGKLRVVRTTSVAPTSGKVPIVLTDGPPDPTRSGQWARWCPGCDSLSIYGSPLFADSSVTSLNLNLTRYSLARYAGSDSSDIGAIAYTAPPVLFYYPGVWEFSNGPRSSIDSMYLVIRNDGDSDSLRVTGLAVSGLDSAVGSITLSETTATLGPGLSVSVNVKFTPGSGRVYENGRWVYRASSGDAVITGATNDPISPTLSLPITVIALED